MDLSRIPDDFTDKETDSLQKYVKDGCPGLVRIDEIKVTQWFTLYMAGKTYSEIAQATNSKKVLVLYIANRARWGDKRMDYYTDLSENLVKKLQQSKIDSANTVTTMISALGKYLNGKFTQYLSTNNESIINDMDVKIWTQYNKAVETLDKLLQNSIDRSSEPNGPTPAVTVNINGPADVEQKDDQTLDITQDTEATALLKALAKYKKSQNK